MKFGKQFEAQQVPEWNDAYTDYKQLKALVKKIRRRQCDHLQGQEGKASKVRRLVSTLSKTESSLFELEQQEEMIVLASDSGRLFVDGDDEEVQLQTAILGVEDELEQSFFRMLDTELNKVNKFYESKAKELADQAAALDSQTEALLTVQQSCIKEDSEGAVAESSQIRINVPAEKPADALALLLSDLANDKSLLNLHTRKVKKARKMLRQAFVEFYKASCILKNFCSLNLIAFSKILKKYDKVSGRNVGKKYLKVVERSSIGTSDQVLKLVEKVEILFTKQFANSNRNEAMKLLRPQTREERHRVTFSLGFFTGLTTALAVALLLFIHDQRVRVRQSSTQYMNAIFPIFSMLTAIMLHLMLYGVNVYFWRKTRINHTFILGLDPKTQLQFRDVFLMVTGLSTLALTGLIFHLQATSVKGERCCKTSKEAIPLIVITGMILLLFLPFNTFYRSSRFFFLRTLWHCLLTPLYKVAITDFLLADHLTSQVQALRDSEYVLCYYGGSFFKSRDSGACLKNQTFITFGFVIVLLPYWCRFMQCLRRWFEEQDISQIYNALKYFFAILAVALRLSHGYNKETGLLVITIIISAIATIYATYWDLVHDWGLLNRDCENPWLRDKLAIKFKSVYYFAMISNVLLRFAWLQNLIDIRIEGLNPKWLSLFVACLEVVRRGQWNYYRLENEHFNNVGKFRAVKSVPLPFVDVED